MTKNYETYIRFEDSFPVLKFWGQNTSSQEQNRKAQCIGLRTEPEDSDDGLALERVARHFVRAGTGRTSRISQRTPVERIGILHTSIYLFILVTLPKTQWLPPVMTNAPVA